MLSNELKHKLIAQSLQVPSIERLLSTLQETPFSSLDSLFAKLQPANPLTLEEFQTALVLLLKRDLITIERDQTASVVKLNEERIERLVYKGFLVDFALRTFGEAHSILVNYFFIHSFATRQQVLSDYALVSASFKAEAQAPEKIEQALDDLIRRELLIDYTGSQHGSGIGGQLELPKNLKTLNFRKLVSLVRTEHILRYCQAKFKPKVLEVIRLVLSASGVYNRAAVVKKTEPLGPEALKKLILTTNSKLLGELNFDQFVLELPGLQGDIIGFQPIGREFTINLESVINLLKVEVLENYLGSLCSPGHVRVLRAITLLKLNTLKLLEDNVLLKKAELRNILADLEELSVIKSVSFGLNSGESYYQASIETFIEEMRTKYLKMVENILLVKDRPCEPHGSSLDDDERFIRACKAEITVRLIAERLLVLCEF